MKGNVESIKYASGIAIKGSRVTRFGFNSTTKKDVNRKEFNSLSPGPGAYDLTFKDIIKMMDQKLAIRYQISPFGSCKPRFLKKESVNIQPSVKTDIENAPGFTVRDKHAAADIINEHYKNKEKYRGSYTYQSKVERFENKQVQKSPNSKNSNNILNRIGILNKTPEFTDTRWIDEDRRHSSKHESNNKLGFIHNTSTPDTNVQGIHKVTSLFFHNIVK